MDKGKKSLKKKSLKKVKAAATRSTQSKFMVRSTRFSSRPSSGSSKNRRTAFKFTIFKKKLKKKMYVCPYYPTKMGRVYGDVTTAQS